MLALNAIRPRFWCRYLCPLGALLGLVSKVAWLRRMVGETLRGLRPLSRACPTGTIDPNAGFASDPAECTMCLDCVPACAKAGPAFPRPLAAGRLAALRSRAAPVPGLGGAALAVVGLAAVDRQRRVPSPLDPAAGRAGSRLHVAVHPLRPVPEGLPDGWPAAQPGRGGVVGAVDAGAGPAAGATATTSATPCGEVCPTGAIPPLALAEKRQTVIGHAYIDTDRCIPWADDRTCLVCEEMCPLPEKAIQLEEVAVTAADGTAATVRLPHVLRDRCIGCGICENRCPLAGEAAIRVYAVGELVGY